jgi:hypothetical protein
MLLDDFAPCKQELDDLVTKKKREFGQKERGKNGALLSERMNSISGSFKLNSYSHHPKTRLVPQ